MIRAPREWQEKLVLAHRILSAAGVFEYNLGHASVRLDDRVLILGHIHPKGTVFDQVTTEDLSLMDLNGVHLEGELEPPGERYIHTAIYRAREDVRSVVHAHPRTAVAFTVAGRDILPVSYRGAIFSPKVPVWPKPGQVDTEELGREVAAALGSARAVLLAGHGAASVGGSLEDAVAVMIELEETAKLQLTASLLGEPRPLHARDLEGGMPHGLGMTDFARKSWDYYKARV